VRQRYGRSADAFPESRGRLHENIRAFSIVSAPKPIPMRIVSLHNPSTRASPFFSFVDLETCVKPQLSCGCHEFFDGVVIFFRPNPGAG
jgi:hypothetical protein